MLARPDEFGQRFPRFDGHGGASRTDDSVAVRSPPFDGGEAVGGEDGRRKQLTLGGPRLSILERWYARTNLGRGSPVSMITVGPRGRATGPRLKAK